jgi:hypothetical protein
MADCYRFPETRFSRTNTIRQQYFHLVSEVLELGRALFRAWLRDRLFKVKDYSHAARESHDVIQSDESLQRLIECEGADIDLARRVVVEGCRFRGYYEI